MAHYYTTCSNHLVCLDKIILLNDREYLENKILLFSKNEKILKNFKNHCLIIRYIVNTKFWIMFSSKGTQLFWALHNVRVECKHVLSQDIAQKIQSKSRNGPIQTFMIYKHVVLLFNQMHLCESETKRYKHLGHKIIE